MRQDKCVFCKRDAEWDFISGSSSTAFKCPSCGNYGIADTTLNDFRLLILSDEYMRQISCILVEHKLKRMNPFLIGNSQYGELKNFIWKTYKDLLNSYPKEASEILNRSLINLSRMINHPSEPIPIDEESKEIFYAKNSSQILYMLRQLAKEEYITPVSSLPSNIQIESKGWQKVELLKRPTSGANNQVFVAMWFTELTNNIYTQGIKPAIESIGNLKPIRIDMVEHNNKICDQIIAEIKKSKFLIADFTGNRGGVYFEAGFAQGLGLPVIWLVKEEDVNNLHFDTRQYNHIVYKDVEDLRKKLIARIEATII